MCHVSTSAQTTCGPHTHICTRTSHSHSCTRKLKHAVQTCAFTATREHAATCAHGHSHTRAWTTCSRCTRYLYVHAPTRRCKATCAHCHAVSTHAHPQAHTPCVHTHQVAQPCTAAVWTHVLMCTRMCTATHAHTEPGSRPRPPSPSPTEERRRTRRATRPLGADPAGGRKAAQGAGPTGGGRTRAVGPLPTMSPKRQGPWNLP